MWVFYAFLSAITAAAVAILGKLGLKGVDSTLATTVRSMVMAVFLISVSGLLGKFQGFTAASFSQKDWILIVLSGVAGATSWLFYFLALKSGFATHVAAIDRLSLVFVVILSGIFLGESMTVKVIGGAILMVLGVLLITWK